MLPNVPRLAQITIEDFQSLERACLDLDRLVVITGHTGSGKSSVVRALQAAFFNWSGGGFVREGAEATRVTLSFGQGAEVAWTKPRKGGARYDLVTDAGSAVITRVGRETAPEIQAITGVWEVECEGVREAPQIDSQFDSPFLLAGTGGAAAKLLAKVSRLDVLLSAQIAAKRDADRAKKDHDDAAAAVERLRSEIEAMPDYDRLLADWKLVAVRVDELGRRAESLARARQLVEMRSRAERQASASSTAHVAPKVTALQAGLGPLETAARFVSDLAVARRNAERVVYDLSAASANKKKVDEELHEVLGEMTTCPVCGAVVVQRVGKKVANVKAG